MLSRIPNSFKVYQFLLFAIAVLIPFIENFKTKFASIAIILLIIWWLATLDFKTKMKKLLENKIIFLFLLLYLINIHGLFINVDNNIGEKVLIKKMAMFFMPLIIGTGPALEFKMVKHIIFFFITSLILSSILTFSRGVEGLILSPEGLNDLAAKITIHRPYFGLFCAFGILALVLMINRRYKLFEVTLTVLVSLYLLFFIFFIYAKMTLVALFLTVILLVFLGLLHRKKYKVITALCLLSLFTLVGIYKFIPSVNSFVNNIKSSKDFSYNDHNILIVGSINVRYINWGCAVQILKENNNWLTGVGAGNAQLKLQKCYKDLNSWIHQDKMNSHNQYLEEMLFNGIFGLFVLLACIVVPLILAYRQNNFHYIGFILIVALCCLTENILSRGIGIIFYSFFNSLLFLFPKKAVLKP